MQQSEQNLINIRTESAVSSKEMMTLLEQQDQIIQELQQQNERLNTEQIELMNLVESYKDQLLDWQEQNRNQQRLIDDYLSTDAGKKQKEIVKLKKRLEKVEADNFNEMIQRRYAEELADRWKRIAEKGGSRKGV